ncbi:hypothetical protein OPAG_00714 [Rhodococcus opacus PD630]|nr:hypothetical protein OPAG_00714 [Rhodococcus opacus PD630]
MASSDVRVFHSATRTDVLAIGLIRVEGEGCGPTAGSNEHSLPITSEHRLDNFPFAPLHRRHFVALLTHRPSCPFGYTVSMRRAEVQENCSRDENSVTYRTPLWHERLP